MRGFDKLEEGRSRVLVYQVGSNRLYTRMLLDGCIRWIVRWILIRSQWIHSYHNGCQQSLLDPVGSMCMLDGSLLDPSGCQQSLLDPCVSQLDPCISQWILVGSMCIQLDPCISQQSLYRPQYIHYQILVDPCRSLVYPLVSLHTHSIPINPLLSTLIHPIHLFYIF